MLRPLASRLRPFQKRYSSEYSPVRQDIRKLLGWVYFEKSLRRHNPRRQFLRFWLAFVLAYPLLAVPAGLNMGVVYAHPDAYNNDDEVVYLDPSGVIRVLDTNTPPADPVVRWFSPTGNWTYFDLGDVNADGDMEIVAVGVDGAIGKLAVFDPVMTGPLSGQSKTINGIAWDVLYETQLPGPPTLVATGEFDVAQPGAEIVYDCVLPPGDRVQHDDHRRIVILKSGSATPDGRSWQEITTYDSGNDYTWIATGEVDGVGADEIVLVNSVGGNLSIFRLDGEKGLVRIFKNSSSEREWQNAEIGQYEVGGLEEIVAVREADLQWPTLFVLQYVGADTFSDLFWVHNNPSPRFVFLADISGNGDKEIVVLRKVRPELGSLVRLFVFDHADTNVDTIALWESELDADNGYLTGAGGDEDGDGRDEFILLRDNTIKIFTEPEKSESSQEYPVSSGVRLVRAGNLDANEPVGVPVMGATPSALADTLVSNEQNEQRAIFVSDISTSSSQPFTVRLENGSRWVSVATESAQTPARLSVAFDASGLEAGQYRERLLIESSNKLVANQPCVIDLSMTVKSGIAADPAALSFVYFPCANELDPLSQNVQVSGPDNAIVTATFQQNQPWVSVQPISGTIPLSLAVTVDPQIRREDVTAATTILPEGPTSATLVLQASLQNGSVVSQTVPIHLTCAQQQLHLPAISR